VIFGGNVDEREVIAFWLAGGRVLAGMNVNVRDVTDPIQALVRSGDRSRRAGWPTRRCRSTRSSITDRRGHPATGGTELTELTERCYLRPVVGPPMAGRESGGDGRAAEVGPMQPSSMTTRGRPAGRALLLVAELPMHCCTGDGAIANTRRVGSGVDAVCRRGSSPTPAAAARRSTPSSSSGMRCGRPGDVPDRRRDQLQVLGELAEDGRAASADAAPGRSRAQLADMPGRKPLAAGGALVGEAARPAGTWPRSRRWSRPDGHAGQLYEVTGLRLLTFAEAVGGDRQDGRPPDRARVKAGGRPDPATKVGASAGPSPGSSLIWFERPARRA
jgi:hypothetical protein